MSQTAAAQAEPVEVEGEEAKRLKVQIQGSVFEIEAKFFEGYALKANEAAAMNQLLAENIRNNVASIIRTAKLKAAGWSDEQIKAAKAEQSGPVVEKTSLPPETMAELQATIDEYVASYEFGVRSGRTKDPFEREVENVAKAILDDALKAAGRSPSKLFKDDRAKYDALLTRIITENREEIERRARAIMEQKAGLGLDLGDLSKLPEGGDDENGEEEGEEEGSAAA